jgi:hypothetical protein
MIIRSWIRQLFARTPRPAPGGPAKAPSRFRPTLEALEGRLTPSMLGTTALLEGPAAGSASDLVLTSGPWSASANAGWLHTSAAGTGNGLATFTFDANPGATRSGTLTIAGLTLTVTQAGSTYAPANPLTLAASGLNKPRGVAADGAGDVFIADSANNAIKEWQASTQAVSTLVSSGLSDPAGVAVDGAGNVFIADTLNRAIKEWQASTQTVSTLVSSGLTFPGGVAVDGAGNVFIADTNNHVIKEWQASTQTVSTLVSASGLPFPQGVAVDGAGNVFIAGSDNNAIQEWQASTQAVSALVSSGLNNPYGVAVDGSGNVFIADKDNNAVKELPRAFVPGGAVSEGPAAGQDALPPVLPATQPLSGPFAPSSDQPWLTVGPVAHGVVNFSFAQNSGPSRTAHLTVLGQQVTVTQAAPVASITVTDYSVSYDGLPHTATGTATGAGGVDLSADLSLGGTRHTVAGSYIDTWTFHDPTGTYQDASGTVSDNITPATLTITPDAAQSKAYGSPVPVLTWTASGFATGDSAAVLSGGLGTTATAASPVGSYPITLGTLSAGGNYTVVLAASPPTFAVTPATLTIAPAAGQSKVYGAPVPALAFTATGFVNGDPASTLAGALATTATAASPVGSYAFTLGSLTAGSNYTVALAANPPTFAVTPATLTVTANDATKIQGEANPAFTVSYSGFVLGDGPGVLGGTLSFSTPATTTSPPGSYAITSAGLTSGNYAITFVSGTLTVLSYAQATANLQAQVDTAGLDHGMQSSLDDQLQAALALFNAGDTADGVSQLGAFINHVSAQRGNHIAAALADAWIAYAQRIITAVG